MRSLFLKIFLWFWISNALITTGTVAFFIATRDNENRDNARRGRGPMGTALNLTAKNVAFVWEHEGKQGLQEFVKQAEEATDMSLWVFRVQGKDVQELTGDSVTKSVDTVARQAIGSTETARLTEGDYNYSARPVVSKGGASYIMVSRGRDFSQRAANGAGGPGGPGRGGPLGPQAPIQAFFTDIFRWLPLSGPRLWIFLAGAGLVCYALASYLTSPVRKLRLATNLLADGDLSARVGQKMGRRRDELADLGRDFDKMAERIQNLMLSERRLLGDVSHELRSPLARLQVALELAEQGASEETQEYLDRIRLESQRLNTLIGQLLALARMESGDQTKAREVQVNIRQLVDEIAQDADFEARSQNRSVIVTHNDAAQTTGSNELLRSALENVVRNAVRYTGEKTKVEIEQRNQGGQALIRVRDHGPGVPTEALSDLFRPFYRVAQARDRQSGGVGLGLAIAERAIRAHGGSVKAENAPDGGLLVEFRLPLNNTSTISPA